MSAVVWAALAFIVTLGVLIAVHEYGHFWVARRLGVKVLRYSIGFGKPLWLRRYGPDQTEYTISAIPLGGYVKMLDEREGEVAPAEQHRAFNRQSVGTRFAIVAAGPIANFLLAIVAYWLMFVVGVPGIKPVIGDVEPDSIAASAGFRSGDELIGVDGRSTPTWSAARLELLNILIDGGSARVVVRSSDGAERELMLDVRDVPPDLKQGNLLDLLGLESARPHLPAVIGQTESGSVAEKAGLVAGDKIITVDGQAVQEWNSLVEYVRQRPGQAITLEVERDAVVRRLELTPARVTGKKGDNGRIGAAPLIPDDLHESMRSTQQLGPVDAVTASLAKTWQMSAMTVRMIGKMLVGDVSLDNLSGPLTIASYAGYTAAVGIGTFLSFLAVISISLGVLNLLPVPLLDGGHLAYYCIEMIRGRPLSESIQIRLQRVGLIVLVMLMALAMYNDIRRLFFGD